MSAQSTREQLSAVGIPEDVLNVLEKGGMFVDPNLIREATDDHFKEMGIAPGYRLLIRRVFPYSGNASPSASGTAPAVAVVRNETPEDLIRACGGGDADAGRRLLASFGRDFRFVATNPDGSMDTSLTLEYYRRRQDQPRGVAMTLTEYLVPITRHCPLDGSELIDGENVRLSLSYKGLSDDDLIRLRLCLQSGQFQDSRGAVDTFIAGGPFTSSRWISALRYADTATDEEKLTARRFVLCRTETSCYYVQADPVAAVARDPATEGRSSDSPYLGTWRERLAYLLSQEAVLSDPAQKFAVARQIAEARAKIKEYGG